SSDYRTGVGVSVALFIPIISNDMAPIEEQGVLEHHLVAYGLAKGCEILLGQANLSGKASARIADVTQVADRPIASPNKAIRSEVIRPCIRRTSWLHRKSQSMISNCCRLA